MQLTSRHNTKVNLGYIPISLDWRAIGWTGMRGREGLVQVGFDYWVDLQFVIHTYWKITIIKSLFKLLLCTVKDFNLIFLPFWFWFRDSLTSWYRCSSGLNGFSCSFSIFLQLPYFYGENSHWIDLVPLYPLIREGYATQAIRNSVFFRKYSYWTIY